MNVTPARNPVATFTDVLKRILIEDLLQTKEAKLEKLSLAKEPVAYQHVTLKLLEEHLKEQMNNKSDPVVVTACMMMLSNDI